jgi:hypothetical protein
MKITASILTAHPIVYYVFSFPVSTKKRKGWGWLAKCVLSHFHPQVSGAGFSPNGDLVLGAKLDSRAITGDCEELVFAWVLWEAEGGPEATTAMLGEERNQVSILSPQRLHISESNKDLSRLSSKPPLLKTCPRAPGVVLLSASCGTNDIHDIPCFAHTHFTGQWSRWSHH